MIQKKSVQDGEQTLVTFALTGNYWRDPISVVGDFNSWNPLANPLEQNDEGNMSTTLVLQTGQRYAFRYLDAAGQWYNDGFADDFELTGFESYNSILET